MDPRANPRDILTNFGTEMDDNDSPGQQEGSAIDQNDLDPNNDIAAANIQNLSREESPALQADLLNQLPARPVQAPAAVVAGALSNMNLPNPHDPPPDPDEVIQDCHGNSSQLPVNGLQPDEEQNLLAQIDLDALDRASVMGTPAIEPGSGASMLGAGSLLGGAGGIGGILGQLGLGNLGGGAMSNIGGGPGNSILGGIGHGTGGASNLGGGIQQNLMQGLQSQLGGGQHSLLGQNNNLNSLATVLVIVAFEGNLG